MEDSEFSSDFAVNFLNWDEDDITGDTTGPTDTQKPTEDEVKVTAPSTSTKDPVSTANVNGTQYLIPRGGHQPALIPNMNTNIASYSELPPVGTVQPIFSHPGATVPTMTTNSATTQSSGQTPVGQPASVTDAQSSSSSQPSNTSSATHSTFPINATVMKAPQLHPLGIQSSANCPPHISGILPAAPPNPHFLSPLMYNPLLHANPTQPNQHFMTMVQAPNGQHQHLSQQQIPLQPQQQSQPQQPQQQQPQSQVPTQAQHIISQQHTNQQQVNPHQQQQQQNLQPASAPAVASSHQTPVAAPVASSHQTPAAAPVASPQKSSAVVSTTNMSQQGASTTNQTQQGTNKPMPPFYLFDAPCELRTNFIASQRMHNLPVKEDNNSFHYGMAVNGFHPQLNAQVNPVLPLPRISIPPDSVQLVDGRSKKNKKTGKERNEREQKRAQKITELIEQLRVSMEQGGWKVEMKSKFHTLSTCSDYVKHLVNVTKEKQAAVDKAKADLEMKESKLEEAARSDPESVTSSLTTSSTSESSPNEEPTTTRKRSSSPDERPAKQAKTEGESPEESGRNSNTSRLSENDGPGGHNISLRKNCASTVSDITDSNRGSSEGEDSNKADNSDSGNSISSTAAVARNNASDNQEHEHADVVVKRKALSKEISSIHDDFDLDYEDVFISSNVPQLIATTAGRIVTCNNFFEKITGLSREEISKLTIFSIVQGDKLSNLFEMLGEALRNGSSKAKDASPVGELISHSSGSTTIESEPSNDSNRNYAAMTLPCVSFPSRTNAGKNHHPNPLYMTMTLMTDKNPQRRCFHCAITDHPGTNGAMGYVTADLLKMLFADNQFATGPKQVSSSSSDSDANNTSKDEEKSGGTEKEAVESQNVEESTKAKSD